MNKRTEEREIEKDKRAAASNARKTDSWTSIANTKTSRKFASGRVRASLMHLTIVVVVGFSTRALLISQRQTTSIRFSVLALATVQ